VLLLLLLLLLLLSLCHLLCWLCCDSALLCVLQAVASCWHATSHTNLLPQTMPILVEPTPLQCIL
jgi:hypothetical protein